MGAFSFVRRRATLLASGFGSLALSGCPLDDRALGAAPELPPHLTVPGTGAGGAAGAVALGEAGGAGGALSLVGSWDFDRDAGEWHAEDGTEQSWGAVDADGNAASGSLAVTNSAVASADVYHALGSSVCLTVGGGVTYDISAEILIDQGQNTGSGGFVVAFFNAPAARGTSSCSRTTSPRPRRAGRSGRRRKSPRWARSQRASGSSRANSETLRPSPSTSTTCAFRPSREPGGAGQRATS